MMTGTGQERALDELRYDWGDAYEIGLDDDSGVWWARRRDAKGGRIEAPAPDGLRKLIVEDYTFMPVPRDLP
jgi:hypothetical protein